MTVYFTELWAETTLPNSNTTLVTAPTGTNGLLIKRAVFTNTSGSAATITVYKVPPAGSAATGNAVTYQYSIGVGVAFVPPELINMVIPVGGKIVTIASAGSAINTTASGLSL